MNDKKIPQALKEMLHFPLTEKEEKIKRGVVLLQNYITNFSNYLAELTGYDGAVQEKVVFNKPRAREIGFSTYLKKYKWPSSYFVPLKSVVQLLIHHKCPFVRQNKKHLYVLENEFTEFLGSEEFKEEFPTTYLMVEKELIKRKKR